MKKKLNLLSASISSIKDIVTDCSQYGIPLVLQMEETLFNINNTGIVHLESSLLDIGASPSVVQGIDLLHAANFP